MKIICIWKSSLLKLIVSRYVALFVHSYKHSIKFCLNLVLVICKCSDQQARYSHFWHTLWYSFMKQCRWPTKKLDNITYFYPKHVWKVRKDIRTLSIHEQGFNWQTITLNPPGADKRDILFSRQFIAVPQRKKNLLWKRDAFTSIALPTLGLFWTVMSVRVWSKHLYAVNGAFKQQD